MPAGAYGVMAGTPEDDVAKDHTKAEVGVFETVNGIETRLVIPMWYGDETGFESNGAEPVPMPQAVQAASEHTTSTLRSTAVWFGDAVVDVEFHMDSGVLILDRVEAPPIR